MDTKTEKTKSSTQKIEIITNPYQICATIINCLYDLSEETKRDFFSTDEISNRLKTIDREIPDNLLQEAMTELCAGGILMLGKFDTSSIVWKFSYM